MNSNVTNPIVPHVTQQHIALVAGFGLLIMTFGAIFAEMYSLQQLFAPDDAETTLENILSHPLQFRLSILAYLIVFLLDIVVAWALFIFFKPVNHGLSLLAAWMRIVYTVVAIICLFYLSHVLRLIEITTLNQDTLETHIYISLHNFYDSWGLAFIFFGMHLVFLGYLAFTSGFIHKIFGILLLLAGISYMFDYMIKIVYPGFDFQASLILGWGELVFMFWLLFAGGKTGKSNS